VKMMCKTKICKSGKNLFARVPDEYAGKIGRGDEVKITIIKKAKTLDKKQAEEVAQQLISNQGCKGKFKGTIDGFPAEFSTDDLLKSVSQKKVLKFFSESLYKSTREQNE